MNYRDLVRDQLPFVITSQTSINSEQTQLNSIYSWGVRTFFKEKKKFPQLFWDLLGSMPYSLNVVGYIMYSMQSWNGK